MASSVDLPTPEPAKMPMRWPEQMRREHVDDPDAGLQRRAHAVAAHGGRRLTVDGYGPLAIEERALAIDRCAERVDDAALPRGVRVQRSNRRAARRCSPMPVLTVARMASPSRQPRRCARPRRSASPARLQADAFAEPQVA